MQVPASDGTGSAHAPTFELKMPYNLTIDIIRKIYLFYRKRGTRLNR
jgi:hypothetical protein